MKHEHDKQRHPAGAEENQANQGDATAKATPTGDPEGGTVEFIFEGQTVRTAVTNGQTWFVAADVCAVLQHTDPSKAASRLEDDERGATTVRTPGGAQEMLTVNESGLYSLIFTSRKPQARAFRRWVTDEVLPAIRKTGRYEQHAAGNAPKLSGRSLRVELPGYGRYIILARGEGHCDVRRTEYEATLQEGTNTDVRLLSHHLGVIEGFWHKVKLLRSLPLDPEGGFALSELEEAILAGGRLGQQYLMTYARPGSFDRATDTSGNA